MKESSDSKLDTICLKGLETLMKMQLAVVDVDYTVVLCMQHGSCGIGYAR